jgi:hypothetical protein
MRSIDVEVWNDHTEDYKEKFRDRVITVPAKGHIVMPRSEARQFLAQYSPMMKDGKEQDVYPKKLRIVEDPEAMAERYDQPERYESADGTRRFRTLEGRDAYDRLQKEKLDAPAPTRRRIVAANGKPLEAGGSVEGHLQAG